MDINSNNVDELLTDVAVRYIRDGYNFENLLQGNLPEDVASQVNALISYFACNLSEKDRKDYGGYGEIFRGTEPISSGAIAKAKVSNQIEHRKGHIIYERYIRGRFEDSALEAQYPELAKYKDRRHGLVPLRLFRPLPDALEYRSHALYPDPHIPYELRCLLLELFAERKIKCDVALSHYGLVPRKEYRPLLIEARIWGKPFDPEDLKRRLYQKRLLTVYKREPKSELEEILFRFRCLVDRLEILRTERDNKFFFTFEELVPLREEHSSIGYVTTRMLHSELTFSKEVFDHVDGNLLIYDIDRYKRRFASDLCDKVKANGHYKLFNIKEGCGIELWGQIAQRFYPGDELVSEYFDGI